MDPKDGAMNAQRIDGAVAGDGRQPRHRASAAEALLTRGAREVYATVIGALRALHDERSFRCNSADRREPRIRAAVEVASDVEARLQLAGVVRPESRIQRS
jgi:hypothetical protein